MTDGGRGAPERVDGGKNRDGDGEIGDCSQSPNMFRIIGCISISCSSAISS
jgi:hypothetical protein